MKALDIDIEGERSPNSASTMHKEEKLLKTHDIHVHDAIRLCANLRCSVLDCFMTSPSRSTTHRLLYRGSLSLPDSDLSLDGLTFSAKINAEHNLLENPLALALESMRGRPTLRFMGVTSLKEIHMDDSGDIAL